MKSIKIIQTFVFAKNIPFMPLPFLLNLLLLPFIVSGIFFSPSALKTIHPYYVSVTEIEYSVPDKELQVACKIFTDDFENALKEMYRGRIDLYHPDDKPLLNKQISGYIASHFRIKADDKLVQLNFLGYEIEGEAAWCYFSAAQQSPVKRIEVFNNLLYEYKKEQINIIHARIGSDRKSARLASPHTSIIFSF